MSRQSYRMGFTLVELVLSMSVASVLMAGLASAMVLASRALPDPDSPLTSAVNSHQVLDEIVGDLYTAITFITRTPNEVTFTVADRDNNNAPEVIRYAWSGTLGTSLIRQYNGGTVVHLINQVSDFQLAYTLQTIVTVGEDLVETTQYFVHTVGLSLLPVGETATRFMTTVEVLNQPEVSEP